LSGTHTSFCCLALAIIACAFAGSGAATGGGSTSQVVMFSDRGDYIGGGSQREFDSTNAEISVSGTTADLDVRASGGTAGDSYDFHFAAPPGGVLASGSVYTGAQRTPFRQAGHPGIDIYGTGRGCNTDSGSFEVKDIATDAGGAISGLWIVYEQHCEGSVPALWGEVRIGEPDSGGARLAPGIVRWPAVDLGATGTSVPVTLSAVGGATTVSSVTLTGADPADYVADSDQCSGKTISAGSSCQVFVHFKPVAAGTRQATLHFVDSNGKTYDAVLQGFAYGGTTQLTMTSDPGDFIGQGQGWSYTPATATFLIDGDRSGITFRLTGANGDDWSGSFKPTAGDIIVPGTYPNATRYSFSGAGAGLDVSGNGRGCNTLQGSFTVNSVKFARDGSAEQVALAFEQHCEGGAAALHGTFLYRAGDTTQPAPWMVSTTALGAAGAGWVSMFSDGGDYIGAGSQREFDSANAQISVSGSTADLDVSASGGTAGDSYDFHFAAAPGGVLGSGGIYTDAQRTPFRQAGHPGIDISGTGRGCNTDSGSFEVKDIATGAGGAISRLWILYEQHCEGGTPALFGEIRLGEPTPAAPTLVPGIIRWPATQVGATSTVVPVTVIADAGPLSIASVSLTGPNPDDFGIRADECQGTTLAAGDACQVWVRFTPGTAGTRIAMLHVVDTQAHASDVVLEGYDGGQASWTIPTAPPLTTANPTINSFSPSAGPAGSWVLVSGSNLASAAAVAFNGASASFLPITSTQLLATVPAGATTGHISVTNANGTTISAANFTVGTIPPGAPTSVTAVAGNGRATVSFSPPASNGGATITSYTVTSSPGGKTATGAGSPLTVTGLTNGTSYTFTVTAANSAGSGLPSAPSNQVTPTAATAPGPPLNVSATPGDGRAIVRFQPPSSDGGTAITSYTATSSPGGKTATGSSSPLVVTGLTNGTSYSFMVTATNAVGSGSPSAPSNAVTPGAGTAEIAFESDRGGFFDLYTMTAAGANQRPLASSGDDSFAPAWSPDGTRVVFDRVVGENDNIYVTDASGSSVTRLTTGSAIDENASWSPDGTRIVFDSSAGGGDNQKIWVMNSDGTGATQLTSPAASFDDVVPVFSPDGTKIAFASDRPDGIPHIWVMNADGSGQTQLTTGSLVDTGSLSWSPDGSKIAFTSNRAGNLDVWVMNANGTGLKDLTPSTPGVDGDPAWSPDGSMILFESDRGDGTDLNLYVMNADGSGIVRLTTTAADDGLGSWRPSPSAPSNIAAPAISGTAQVGSVLVSTYGSWSSPAVFGYEWLRCTNTNQTSCSAIPNASSASYTPGADDLAMFLRVSVTATNTGGVQSATSAALGPVAAARSGGGGGGGGGGGSSSFALSLTPASQTISAGGTATFTVSVTNTGGGYLRAIQLSDPAAPNCARPSSTDADTLNFMAPNVTVSYSCSLSGIGSTLTNTISATADNGAGTILTQTASAGVTVQTPFTPPVSSAAGSTRTTSSETAKRATLLLTTTLRATTLHARRPTLTLTARLTSAATLTFRLLDANGHELARWTEKGRTGTNTFVLLLPVKARHPGRDKFRIATAVTNLKSIPVTLER
jgi:Tol biopolymer transport system component